MAKIKYVLNPFTGNFDAINKPLSDEACIEGIVIGDTLEWVLPNGSSVYSSNLIGATGFVYLNGVPVEYVRNIGTGELCLAMPNVAAVANQTPKLIATFDTTIGTVEGDLVKVTGTNFVEKISSNTSAEIPNGIFGVCYNKPEPEVAEVIFVGIMEGYSGLTVGAPVFVDLDGTPDHLIPATGTIQQIGFAVSATEIFYNLMQAVRRA